MSDLDKLSINVLLYLKKHKLVDSNLIFEQFSDLSSDDFSRLENEGYITYEFRFEEESYIYSYKLDSRGRSFVENYRKNSFFKWNPNITSILAVLIAIASLIISLISLLSD